MIIIFNGDTLDLKNRLQQWSGRDEKSTLDFMLQNFKIDEDEKEVNLVFGRANQPSHPIPPGTVIA